MALVALGWRSAMRGGVPASALVAAGPLRTAGCTSGGASPGGSAPSTDGIGPITFAIGKDNPGWLQGVITGWNQRHPSQKEPQQALTEMAGQLTQIIRAG